MAFPLAPPPPTGNPIDRWLYLLWRKLTATGQLFWSSIVPGTSADVAAAVTDETGSPGSLVFSGNPTMQSVTVAGDLTFSGSARRITGDFSTATIADRMAFQSNVPNGLTTVTLLPNGTGTTTQFAMEGSSAPANNSVGQVILIDATEFRFQASIRGTGAYVPITFYAGNAERMRIDTAGVATLGGTSTTPAVKVSPVASQARWIELAGATSSGNPTIGVSGGDLSISNNIVVAPTYSNTTASAPNIYIDSSGKHYRSTYTVGSGSGTGDFSSNTATSVDSEIVLFSSTTGKLGKRATTTGILKGTSGVLSAATAGTDFLDKGTTSTLTAGFSATPYNAGTKSSGTFTPDEANGNFQYYTNGGAHTLAPPTNNCTLIIQITNNGSAGAITTSGFTKVTGTTPTTTNGDDFFAFVTKCNGFSHLAWQALQ